MMYAYTTSWSSNRTSPVSSPYPLFGRILRETQFTLTSEVIIEQQGTIANDLSKGFSYGPVWKLALHK